MGKNLLSATTCQRGTQNKINSLTFEKGFLFALIPKCRNSAKKQMNAEEAEVSEKVHVFTFSGAMHARAAAAAKDRC